MAKVIQALLIGLMVCLSNPSMAQQTAFGFTPSGNTTTMSVTSSSSSITLSSTPQTTVLINNTGTKTAYITNTATATTSATPVPAGIAMFFNFAPSSTISAITGGIDTTTLLITKGSGSSALTGGGSGSGGGGLSVTDQSAWTQGTSAFTPSGGVFNDTATLSSGQQGDFRLTTKRAQIVDVDSSGNQLHSDLTAPIPTQVPTTSIGGVGIIDSAGSNVATVKAASTAPVTTDKSLVVGINPNSINANGQATKANSAPVVLASDQFADPCMSGVAKSSAAINIASATTTQLVAVSGSTSIYVCGYDFTVSEVVTTANTLQFEYGTSTNCTGTTKLTGLYGAGGVLAAAPIHVVSPPVHGTVFSTPASQGLCALTAIGGSGTFQGVLTYIQQ